ncbi:hypothetical protein EN858_06475 [Mesorhizobium sp. M4B.F.Ca.ET.215.01.1.1]|uniref:EB domain-containing protein n=1 Tax=unclassified Mesorhizobium TaxID=325217 RepID=UPI000FCAEE40|nr:MULTISPECIES: EB domain-containing protein [unclassified Mesorhizobium]RUW24073.1 hypothetical protein EOA34_16210 [Mesorhizobium sp. M4B.F.Ca.ET.013.02.1.1]RVD43879.1 hypothetical protein EN741_08985 [Mesorhizobium sp. M4B.F.Ca.ET.019.03.1.1]RWF62171.1 MAG: hypothetical protein EOS47_24705 [Mesorhizobium sp.]TGQ15479.1 hypothetical protein EN858_06475 [Mesorhizobium sp. M4B.F.Ca.ET.215.01.1.1]TGQ45588.1 hypothetical protein EN857_02600 [Mesorhizobium sp. M4B.F.Ca.ET.214.01.1.1]
MSSVSYAFRNTVATVALFAAGLVSTSAFAAQANIKSMSFDTQGVNTTLHVVSSDKQKWDRLKSGTVQFWGHMKIDTRWPGYVQQVGVSLGVCGPSQCGAFPPIWSASPVSRDYDHQENFSFDPSIMALSSNADIVSVPYGDQIIAKCNQHLQPDGPTKSYSFTHTFHATFSALTDKALDMHNAATEVTGGSWPYPIYESHYAEHGSFDVQVACDPVVKPAAQDIAVDFGEFETKNVKLFLTTYRSNQPGSTPGTVCPALKVTSRAQANKAGPVSMRIWRQKDNGPITSEFKQVWASFDAGKNGYFATYEKWENVGATAYFQYKTEIVGNGPFEPFDGWKDITVHCTGAGGGGFTDGPQPDPDNPPAKADWQGEVTVSDSAGSRKLCPRKGQVAFEASRDAPGALHYRIGCSNGAFFTGTAVAFNEGGVFKASAAHDLSISRTRSIQCTLQEIKPNGSIATIDMDAEDFTCIKRTIEPKVDDLVSSTRPDFGKPRLPPVVVDPGRKCLPSQSLLRGKCVDRPLVAACKNTEKLVDGRCIGVSIHCLPGYHQVGLKCVKNAVIAGKCRRDEQRVNGECVRKPSIIIDCKRGYHLVGKACVRDAIITTGCRPTEMTVRGHCVPRPASKTLGLQKLKQGRGQSFLPGQARSRLQVN